MSEEIGANIESNIPVSFIIPNWNHRQLLSECISSICSTAAKMSHEIIVVDNASTDDSAESIRKIYPHVIWIQNKTNLGYAKAVNHGVKSSRGNFIFLLNNDVKLLDDAVEKLLSFLRDNPDAGAVAPSLYYPDGRLQISCRRFPTPSALLLEFLGISKFGSFKKWKLDAEDHHETRVVSQPMASALMIRRDCWTSVGLLDKRFRIFFNDVDWCYRLYKNTAYRIYLYPEAKAIHHYGASADLLGRRKRIDWYKGILRFYVKHFPFF